MAEHHHDHEHASCMCEHDHFQENKKELQTKILLGAVFFALGYGLSEFTSLPAFAYLICFAVSYIAVGFDVVKKALEDMLKGEVFGECFLITLASLGAFAIKEYHEGCAVMLLFTIGEYLQSLAIAKSQAALEAHTHAHEEAKSPAATATQRFIRRFAKVYTPVICVLALAIALVPPLLFGGEWREWIYRGLDALVIGCPCAIVISVPLCFSCAVNTCRKNEIFVKSEGALEEVYRRRNALQNGEESYDAYLAIPDETDEKRAFALRAAKKAVMLSKENITAAIGIKAVILVLVVFLSREVPMWLAAFGDIGVAVLAVLNALRAMKVK